MLPSQDKQYISFNKVTKSTNYDCKTNGKSHQIIFLILTENIPHNSTILHEIKCFFCSFDYLQNQSSVSKINRRTVELR